VRNHLMRAAAGNVVVGPTYDPLATTWLNTVESADGQVYGNTAAADALNQFVLDIKATYSMSLFHQILVLAGPRTPAGCCINLTGGTNGVNKDFVGIGTDLVRQTGLLGDGTSKRINSQLPHSTSPQNSISAGSRITESHTAGIRAFLGAGGGTGVATHITGTTGTPGDIRTQCQASSSVLAGIANTTYTGFAGINRTVGTEYNRRFNSATVTETVNSAVPTADELQYFCRGSNAVPERFSNSRQAVVFFGLGLTAGLAPLETAIQTYMNAIAAAGL